MLKFSGLAAPISEVGPIVTYLADLGFDTSIIGFTPINYPSAIERSLENLATNLMFVVLPSATVTIQLLLNGVPVPGFVTTYAGGETGVKVAVAGPLAIAAGDRLDLRITTTGAVPAAAYVSATIGVE